MDPVSPELQPSVQILEQQIGNFIDEEPIRVLGDSAILDPVASTLPLHGERVQQVGIGRVSTYIYRTEISKFDGDRRVVFPTFASHWAVIVSEQQSPNKHAHAYHLTFHEAAAAQLSPPRNVTREIKFSAMMLDNTPEAMKEVGITQFGHADLMRIGQAMIKAFGSYHRLFWNCQHFARLYLSIITGGQGKFDEWTLSQTSNLFLCAFVVTIPAAATNKKIEMGKAKEMIERFSGVPTSLSDEAILDASDAAITLAEELALADYARNQPNEIRVERRGPLKHMLIIFNDIVERGVGWVTGQRNTRQG